MRLKHLAANMLTVLIVVGVAGTIALSWARSEFSAPGPLTSEAVVDVPKGASLQDVSRLLELHGVVNSGRLFRLGARYSGEDQSLKFGEYSFEPGISMEDALDKLVSGDVVLRFVTVPEGKTSWEAVEILNANPLLTGEVDVPAEGTLFPETYDIQRGQPRADVVARMQAAMKQKLDAAWEARASDLPVSSKEEALVLASIVEKETGLADERPQVAAVFVNRLRRGMKLQSDPTVVYGITEGKGPLGRGLKRSELDRATPYNTYAIEGLPPTPIANPGLAAIQAVLNPPETEYLYFVADGTGGHVFADTLEEHNTNVRRWREIEAEREREEEAKADAEPGSEAVQQ